MIIIYILFWVIVIPIVAIALHVAIRYLNLTIHDRRHPKYYWEDVQSHKLSPPSNPLTLDEIENIIKKIEFKNYE